MQGSFNNALIFLINTLFDLYLFVLAVRLILAWARANYFNPLTQFIIKLTQPLVAPLRRVLPNISCIEISTLVIMFLIEMLKFTLLGLATMGMPKLIGLPILALADMIKVLLNVFFYAIFLQAILSWVQQGYSPVAQVLAQITTPIMRPIQRIVPTIAGFDISPIPALIGLQLLIILVAGPLLGLGMQLAFN